MDASAEASTSPRRNRASKPAPRAMTEEHARPRAPRRAGHGSSTIAAATPSAPALDAAPAESRRATPPAARRRAASRAGGTAARRRDARAGSPRARPRRGPSPTTRAGRPESPRGARTRRAPPTPTSRPSAARRGIRPRCRRRARANPGSTPAHAELRAHAVLVERRAPDPVEAHDARAAHALREVLVRRADHDLLDVALRREARGGRRERVVALELDHRPRRRCRARGTRPRRGRTARTASGRCRRRSCSRRYRSLRNDSITWSNAIATCVTPRSPSSASSERARPRTAPTSRPSAVSLGGAP